MSELPSLPPYFRLLFDKIKIDHAINCIAPEISSWVRNTYTNTGFDVIAVPILRGGIFFFSDLARAITCSLAIEPLWASSYSDHTNASQSEVRMRPEPKDVRNRTILLVDEICDSGKTLRAVKEKFLSVEAREVKTVALIRRETPTSVFIPDWFALEYSGKEWLAGYGLKDRNSWRNLPGIYAISASD